MRTYDPFTLPENQARLLSGDLPQCTNYYGVPGSFVRCPADATHKVAAIFRCDCEADYDVLVKPLCEQHVREVSDVGGVCQGCGDEVEFTEPVRLR
jgi:hypothetical protein